MIPILTTSDTFLEKVDVFDFTITDSGSGDGLSTDISRLALHTSGTADFSKMKWILNGADVSNKEGVYNSSANTLAFELLFLQVADGISETYTLSAYFETPRGLTDNTTFGFSIDGDTDVTVYPNKSEMATGQTAITNNTNAKVDVTATKLIFSTQPSN